MHPDDPRRRAPARRRHPRQVPARRPHQGQGHEPVRQGDRRQPDPLSAHRSQHDHRQRDGQARPRRRHAARSSGSRPRSTSFAPIRATPSCSRACWSRIRCAAFLAKLFRLPSQGTPISIVDVSGVPSEITSVVVSVLARMVFDYAIWSRTEAQRPLLLVCEEAHRYVPKDENPGAARRSARSSSGSPRKAVSTACRSASSRSVRRILAEGVLSQCGTIISMRLNNDRDQACVRAAMPEGARGFLDAIPRCATANASSAAKASRSRSASASTISSRRSARPRPTRASPACGARPATKPASSSAPSSAGAGHGR